MSDAPIVANAKPEEESDIDGVTNGRQSHRNTSTEDEDDEPPSKRRRVQKLKGKPAVADASAPKEDKKVKKNGVLVESAPANATVKKVTSSIAKFKVEQSDDGDELPVRSAKQTPVKSANLSAAVKEEEAASEEEVEDLDEDEDRPEEAAKARAKVLVALKGSGKDPYPDWKAGEDVPYAALCTTFHKIEMTTKRLEILAHCSLFLRQVLRLTPTDLLETLLLMTNKLGADYTGIELGIGESLIMKAIGESTGRALAVIKADQNEIGDLGMVAAKSRSKQPTMFKPKALTVKGVFKGLKGIATIEGQGSQTRKVAEIKKLLSSADAATAGKGVDITKEKGGPSEAKYIVRTLEGKLRLGLAEKSVLVALAQAVVFHRQEYLATSEKRELQAPSTEELAKGETILKSVYRFVTSSIL